MWKIKARDNRITVQINPEQQLTPAEAQALVDHLNFVILAAEDGDRVEIRHYEERLDKS